MQNKMVFVNQTSGYLMVDIVNAFQEKGAKCTLISGSLHIRATNLHEEVVQHKIIAYSKSNVLTRLFTWVVAYFQILWIIKTKYRKSHVFLVSNPPLVNFLPYFLKNDLSFLLYDFYPDVLIKHKWLREGAWLFRMWDSANRKAFQEAMAVFTISQNLYNLVRKRYNLNNTHHIPLWADGDFFKDIPNEENIFVNKHGLEGKFLVVYSGNLGYTHDMDVLVDVAELTTDESIFYLIIGNGEKEELIKKKIDEIGVKNCMYLPFQPAEMLPYTIGCAGLGVVSLSKGFDGLSIPSKTFTLLSAGKPILCIASPESELARLVISNDIGNCFEPQDIKGMAQYITGLAYDKEKQKILRSNAFKTASLYSKSNVNHFIEVFKK